MEKRPSSFCCKNVKKKERFFCTFSKNVILPKVAKKNRLSEGFFLPSIYYCVCSSLCDDLSLDVTSSSLTDRTIDCTFRLFLPAVMTERS